MATTLIDVARELGTEEKCLAYLEALRWPDGLACLNCGSMKVAKAVSTVKARRDKKDGTKAGQVVKTRYVYDCLETECRHQFSATTGTLFHDTHLPLPTWFLAVALMVDAKKGLSAKQMQRHLKIGSYRTAWYLNHRIRKAMEEPGGIFSGTVEMDETFVGGRYDKRRLRAPYDKQGVVGFIERPKDGGHSHVRAFPIAKSNRKNIIAAVKATVSEDAKLYTDSAGTYKALDEDFLRYVVNHIEDEWVRGDVHTNSIENFWSLFKRGVVGSFHQVSIKHLMRYLEEFSYRFNNRAAGISSGPRWSTSSRARACPTSSSSASRFRGLLLRRLPLLLYLRKR